MKDRNVQFPHRYQIVPVAGQESVYDFVPVPGTITEPGTPINKATLLTDETAALYGLTGDDATVDGALKALTSTLVAEVSVPLLTAFGGGTTSSASIASYINSANYEFFLIKYTGTIAVTCQTASKYEIGVMNDLDIYPAFSMTTPATGTVGGIKVNASNIVIKATKNHNVSGGYTGCSYLVLGNATPLNAISIGNKRGLMNAVRVSSGSVTAKIYGYNKF